MKTFIYYLGFNKTVHLPGRLIRVGVQVMVQEYADSEDADKQEDKVMAQRLLDILYATEDGFAVPAGDNEEFWGDKYTFQGVTKVYSSKVTLSARWK